MNKHLYVTCYRVEALVASQLPPREFGAYMAVGTKKLYRGRVLFFEIDRSLQSDYFNLERVNEECLPHQDGKPKRSLYLSIYRVLEHIDLELFKNLYLTTQDGKVLELAPKEYDSSTERQRPYLYQELCPVTPLIASLLPPSQFVRFITDVKNRISVPKIFFSDLRVGEKPGDLEQTLPYSRPAHIRDCLSQLCSEKLTKTVDRAHSHEFFFRTIDRGFYLGSGEGVKFYPFPSIEELETIYFDWWDSATIG